MIPTVERNHSSILISYKNEGILVDCGEGTQRQLRIAKIKPNKITKLLITHWHGDHVLGIPGLLQNLAAHNYSKNLEIYGPKGTKKYLRHMLAGIAMQHKIKFTVKELTKSIFYKDSALILECAPLKHIIPCLAYSLRETDNVKININYTKKFGLTQHPLLGKLQKGKNVTYKGKKILAKKATIKTPGKKVTIIMDTAPNPNALNLAKNSDLLITEATWGRELEKFVKKRKHLTAELAAQIAKKSKSKELILTHFSQRYKSLDSLEKEAKKIFKNTRTAKDFMEVRL